MSSYVEFGYVEFDNVGVLKEEISISNLMKMPKTLALIFPKYTRTKKNKIKTRKIICRIKLLCWGYSKVPPLHMHRTLTFKE